MTNIINIQVEKLPYERVVDIETLQSLYRMGVRYSLTFGTMDLFHLYHALYINAIKDKNPNLKLVVAVDSQEWAKKEKASQDQL
ncbi:MAG: hypothetical protein Fur0024_4750 [Patescibacteria group bacterium]